MNSQVTRARSRAIVATVGLSAVLLSAGCSGTQDPAQAGFLDGVANLSSGAYDERIEQREVARASAEVEAARLEARAVELDAERRALAAQEAAARQRLQRMNSNLAQQQARLRELEAQEGANRAQLAEMQARARAMEARRERLSADPDPALEGEVNRLEQEVASLRRDIDTIIAELAAQE